MIGKPIAIYRVPTQARFSSSSAARFLDISVNTLKSLVYTGKIEARQDDHGRLWFGLDELERYIDSQRVYDPSTRSQRRPARERRRA